MELHFLGTGSAFPSPKRSSSCTVLRHDKGIWIFDCGEGSQIQFQKSTLKPGRINKIFITHLHGDHLFGLPGILCTIGMNNSITDKHLDMYGPIGLRNFVRTSLTLSYANLPYTFSVHEIMLSSCEDFYSNSKITMDVQYWKKLKDISKINLPLHPNETNGRSIFPNKNGFFDVCYDDCLTVTAGLLKHTIPCVGFVIQEDDLPGKLDVMVLKAKGVPNGPLYGKIKAGESVTSADGSIVCPVDCMGPKRRGRKVVILGDTYDSSQMADIAYGANVLVHESTNENDDEEKSIEHGHSSAGMAGSYARQVAAQHLVLTHFSQRYRSLLEEEKDGTESVAKLVEQAKETFQSHSVSAAEDLFILKIPMLN